MTGPAPPIDLESWLAGRSAAAGARELVLGGTGHLLLSTVEEGNVVRHLEHGLLPKLVAPANVASVTLLTGLAPGADLLLVRTVTRWLRRRDVPLRLVGLLPVPPEVLVSDWCDKALENGLRPGEHDIEKMRAALTRAMAECDVLVDLIPDAATRARLDDGEVRRLQYRRLAAVLSEHTDVLIAILRGQSLELPGGTAEVVEWRRHPRLVPRELSTAPPQRDAAGDRRQLIVLDPAVPFQLAGAPPRADAQDALRPARAALDAGNYLQCYDAIARVRARGVDSRALQYLTVLALANAGNARLALRRYGEFEAGAAEDLDEDWLALKGRLLKDLAFRGGSDAASLFLQAAGAYDAAFFSTGGRFSAINAATMYCLGGQPEPAARLAAQVMELLGQASPETDEDRYYWHVTRAEAALILGDLGQCVAALRSADAHQAANTNARSRTRFQLRRLAAHLRCDPALVEVLALPPVIHMRGAPPPEDVREPAAHYAPQAPAAAHSRPLVFIALIGLPELAAAEQCLARGARLYLSLGGERTAEIRRWRERHGEAAGARFADCVANAHEVCVARGFVDGEQHWCARYVESMALGLSLLAAQRLATDWQGLPAAAPDDDRRHAAQAAAAVPAGRCYAGLIFADFVGFSALSDAVLPAYWSQVMAAMARTLGAAGGDILFRHTWGDALHIVTRDALSAARVATGIRAALEGVRAALPGGLARLELRLSVHYAPVFTGFDPVEQAATYYGTQLSFAARIEPVTPPGAIFVTEPFAARLMLEAPDSFALEYAGELELAKNFGKYRLFSLRQLAG